MYNVLFYYEFYFVNLEANEKLCRTNFNTVVIPSLQKVRLKYTKYNGDIQDIIKPYYAMIFRNISNKLIFPSDITSEFTIDLTLLKKSSNILFLFFNILNKKHTISYMFYNRKKLQYKDTFFSIHHLF